MKTSADEEWRSKARFRDWVLGVLAELPELGYKPSEVLIGDEADGADDLTSVADRELYEGDAEVGQDIKAVAVLIRVDAEMFTNIHGEVQGSTVRAGDETYAHDRDILVVAVDGHGANRRKGHVLFSLGLVVMVVQAARAEALKG